MSNAMLMPLERMRVGMSSESASQTQTPGPNGEKRHVYIQSNGRQPAVARIWHRRDECIINLERRGFGGVKIGKGIFEKRDDFVSGNTISRVILIGLPSGVRTYGRRGGAEIAVRINDHERR